MRTLFDLGPRHNAFFAVTALSVALKSPEPARSTAHSARIAIVLFYKPFIQTLFGTEAEFAHICLGLPALVAIFRLLYLQHKRQPTGTYSTRVTSANR